MAWINNRERNPLKAGFYKVQVDVGDEKTELVESEKDYFDGNDWCHFESHRQFIHAWWEPEPWLKTWHIELFVVAVILGTLTFLFANDLVNWITTVAILLTFNHGIIGDRLQEKQSKMDRPTVECYWKLNPLFAAKEVVWIAAFLIMQNYAAIVGSALFFLYPFWRKFYRRRIKPLS